MVVKVDRRPSPRPGTPGVLFDMNFAYSGRGYDVTPDGSSFIIVQDVGEPDNTVMMTVVQNWVREFEED